jgi:hypothetical protein
MSKQHFEALAAQLALVRPDPGAEMIGPGDMEQWRNDCWAVAKACEGFNPRFDFDLFMDWCNA